MATPIGLDVCLVFSRNRYSRRGLLAGDAIVPAVEDRNAEGARNAAHGVAIASLDLQLPYQTQEELDRSRFQVCAHQLVA